MDEVEQALTPLLSDITERRAAFRERSSPFDFAKIHPADADEYSSKGWEDHRDLKKRKIMKRPKRLPKMLEDRVWCLMYSMGYPVLNDNGFNIHFNRHDKSRGKKQIDVFAKDDETVVVAECKTRATRGRSDLTNFLHETENLQKDLANSIRSHFSADFNPKILWIYVTENIIWSEADLTRAEAANVRIITENELQYFEAYISHVGTAGRHQFLAEFLQGQEIPELAGIKVAATKGSFGKQKFYAFTTSARHLLKIAFVNHQALNHPDSRPAYQRMISKSRLKKISEFISGGGYFPTNILVNFTESCKFEPISGQVYGAEGTRFGWLFLPSKYKSAWIIDGQHRLFGFTNLDDDALDAPLFVIAFEQMDSQKEADLFITINHEQKSVPKGLLVALQADLKFGSTDPREGLSALSSALVRSLSLDASGPLFRRFAVPGVPTAAGQNLTIPEAVKGLNRSALLGRVVGRKARLPGYLSGATDEATLVRARKVINGYFAAIMDANPVRWNAGRAGHVSVNPGVRAHLQLMNEALKFLDAKGSIDPHSATPEMLRSALCDFIKPYLTWIADASDEAVADKFSRKFGEGGVTEYFYALCDLVAPSNVGFGSDEYLAYKERAADERNLQADKDITDLQSVISQVVIETLKQVHGEGALSSGDKAYWELGIENFDIRQAAYRKQQQEPVAKRAPKEAYLDLIDFEKIIKQPSNVEHLKPIFSIPLRGVKPNPSKVYLEWLAELNELRRVTAHKSVYRQFTNEDYDFISWIKREIYDRCALAGFDL